MLRTFDHVDQLLLIQQCGARVHLLESSGHDPSLRMLRIAYGGGSGHVAPVLLHHLAQHFQP